VSGLPRNVVDPAPFRLAALVESSDDAIVTEATSGEIDTWNRAAERLFGYSAREAIGQRIDLILPDDTRLDEQQALATGRRGDSGHVDTTAVTKTGERLPVSMVVSPIRGPGDEVLGFSRIIRDVSRQKSLERAAMRLAAIVDSADDAIVSKDVNGIVQSWNCAAERMFGYSAAEMIGSPIWRIIPAERHDEEHGVLARIRAGLKVEHFETVRQRKDGSLVDISLSVSPIKAADGTVIGASKIARDITRQKALEREAFRLAAIVNSSEDAIASKDLNGVVQTWNRGAERVFGYTAEEMIGRSIRTIIPADRQGEEDEVLAKVRAGIAVEHFETVRQRKDGTLIDISLSVSPIRNAAGTIIGASKIARDITAQKRLARQAEEASRVKDEFLATLSHELRTPLNAVLGYTRMLRMDDFADRRERIVDVIERNARILSQLVSDVLDISSIVTGKIRVKLAPCDLVPVLQAAVDVVRPAADAKGVSLQVDVPASPIRSRCDADRLQQVFWNLLTNAVKFTPRGGSVRARATVEKGAAHVTVTDTGIGIRPEFLPFVFQRFWQGDSVRSRETGGLGLGLALARHFVELHGGTIAVASEGENRGTSFTIRLPLHV
jgi:PAS domain S-box-containing protein